ncbi:hypothetical protein HZB07_03990 [Candidatus Saganbacteria bacterium]|nr:hypothetical protein [Candidatus Saganbacteria bacterium]
MIKRKTAAAVKKKNFHPNLGERNQLALAYLEMAKDKLFQRLDEARRYELIREVLAVGAAAAAAIINEHGTNDPRRIAGRLGVRVFGEDNGGKRGSEYRKDRKEIIIYRSFHDKLLREVKSRELSEHLLKYVVAHELFRHLEHQQLGEIYKRYKFTRWRLGPLAREGYLKGLSCVAAQAFTQKLLGLEISPQVFDYLTYVLYTSK